MEIRTEATEADSTKSDIENQDNVHDECTKKLKDLAEFIELHPQVLSNNKNENDSQTN